jgi:hypothetical protein
VQRATAQSKNRKSSEIKLLITNNEFFIAQRAKAQSKTGTICNDDGAEARLGLQAGLSDCVYFSHFFVRLVAHLGFPISFYKKVDASNQEWQRFPVD